MSPVYLLDTNVISELSKPKPNMHVIEQIKEHEDMCAICSTVWEEAVYGYELMPDGKKKDAVWDSIIDVKESYPILPYDDFAAKICGEIRSKCKKAGKTAPFYDSQIAATAIANGMVLITHNTEDYSALKEHSSLKIEDWWE
ncbi:MAG: type II toxin-antitoxin system VapC family toxin [Treponema sp.]|nr:type II toxin-antitoxin system VapC family toxin [Treponema sp.]